MAVWFEKLIRQGVLMVGEHKIAFLDHPGCLHQEIANQWGTGAKYLRGFTYFHTSLRSGALYMGFYIPGTSI